MTFRDGLVPGDLFQRKRGAQEVFRQPPASVDVMGGDRFLPGVEAEPAVRPAEELPRLLVADELLPQQCLDEAVAEEFAQRLD